MLDVNLERLRAHQRNIDRYRRLLALRRTLPREVRADVDGTVLTLRRGNATLVADFASRAVELDE